MRSNLVCVKSDRDDRQCRSHLEWECHRGLRCGDLFGNRRSGAPSDTETVAETAADTDLVGLTIPAGGGGIFAAASGEQTATCTWTNATEAYDVNAVTFRSTGAYSTTPGTPTVTLAPSVSGTNLIIGAAWASSTPYTVPAYFGSASVPADGAAAVNATTTLTITPPASMLEGDLVVVSCVSGANATWSNGVTGGQTWNALTAYQGSAGPWCRLFWCTYNGTWGANPRFDSTVGTNTSAIMHVFRPYSPAHTWAIDVAQATTQYSAPSTPFTVTRTGLTNVNADTVTLACWHSFDDNTWGTLAGTGWVLTGTAQYRNTSGTPDNSSTFAHHLDGPAGSIVPNASKNQATLGGDAGVTAIIAWYASTPAAVTFTTNVSDNFDRADADSLGSNWTEILGDIDIVSNAARGMTASNYSMAVWTANAMGVSQYVRQTPDSTGGSGQYSYSFFRYTNASTRCYGLELNYSTGMATWFSFIPSTGATNFITIQAATLADWEASGKRLGRRSKAQGRARSYGFGPTVAGFPRRPRIGMATRHHRKPLRTILVQR